MTYPKNFENLIFELEKLPGVGQKMAVRIAMKLYKMKFNNEPLIQSIASLRDLKTCKLCGAISDTDLCEICSDSSRNSNQLMIVEEYLDLLSVESSKEFLGYYFILGGLISPINGIMPDSLNIPALISRVKELVGKSEKLEIIFSLNSNMEGEGTIFYIQKELEVEMLLDKVVLSKLALGIPRGADIDFVDSETLKFALRARGGV